VNNLSLSDISKLAITKPLEYQISEEVISGMTAFRRMGHNADVGTTYETVWVSSSAYTYLTSADTIDVVSDSAADDAAGTGARTLYIEGLDGDYNVQSETVSMDGATAVETANEYLRIFTARCETAGTGGVNAGVITVADVTTSTALATIPAGIGKTQQSIWTVPADKTGIILGWVIGDIAGKATTFALFERPYGGSWFIRRLQIVKNQTLQEIFTIPIKIEAKTDVEIKALASGGSGVVIASFDGYYL